MFAPLEAIWRKLDGEARKEAGEALAEARAEAAKFAPLVTAARTDVEAILAEVTPEVKAAVGTRLAQLLADAERLLSDGAGS
jgi:hypothetical protein